MTDTDARKIAEILFEDSDNAAEQIMRLFPKISSIYNTLARSEEDDKEQRWNDYVSIGKKYKGMLVFGDSMKFPVGSDGYEKANQEWKKLYKKEYPKMFY